MKMLISFFISLAIVLVSCDLLSSKKDLQEFIPGTYIARWDSQYSDTHDTLQIIPHLQGAVIQYEIIRRTFHRYTDRNGPQAPTYKVEQWTGSYAPREEQLLIHKNGRVLSFDRSKRQLKMGIVIYQKLSD